MPLFRRLTVALYWLALAALLAGTLAWAPAPAAPEVAVPRFAAAAPTAPPAPQLLLARVHFSDAADRDQLAARLDAIETATTGGYVTAILTPVEQADLLAQGYRVEIDPARTAALNAPPPDAAAQGAGIPGYTCYRTVAETYAALAGLAAAYPTLAQWLDIGDSWEKVTGGGNPGYDLRVLVITNQAVPGPKPAFFLMAAIHAREYTTAELATRYAEYLVTSYGVDPDVTWLLDHFEVHILPQANPDGRLIAETGEYHRKNTNPNGATCFPTSITSHIGTDLNRNADWHWNTEGTSPTKCAQTYPGSAAASEPETQALQAYLTALFPDQRGPGSGDAAPADAAGLLITLHSYGELVLFPWGDVETNAPNKLALQTLGRKFGFFNRYTVCQPSVCLYTTSGTSDDWAYGELGVAGFTFEMGTTFFQGCSTFENTIAPANLPALLYALKAARRPYQAPAGPETLTVTAPITAVVAGQPLTLTAFANDTRYFSSGYGSEGAQAIAAARVSVDAPAWVTGTVTTPLAAADGVFNASVEALTGALDTTGLAPGRHLALVESQDAAGNWGVPSAIFFEILPTPQFIVAPAPSFAVGPTGGSAVHTLWLTNTSSLTNTYALTVTGDAWAATFAPTAGPVGPGAAVPVTVTVAISAPAAAPEWDAAALTITPLAPAGPPVTVTLITAVQTDYNVYAAPPSAALAGPVGTAVTYTVAVTSLGDLADVFNVGVTGQAWTTTAPATVGPLAFGETALVEVVVHIPFGVAVGADDTATVTFASQGNPAHAAAVTLITTANAWRELFFPLVFR